MKDMLREFKNPWLCLAVGSMIILMVLLYSVRISVARDAGQWEDNEVSRWYKSLMQPDVPTLSCCGEADAYWCDDIHVKGDKAYCRITDDRPDGPLGRPHREIGAEFEIPPNKLIRKGGNPTGHNVIFLSASGYTWCFALGGGV